jgi:hypothetical protein
VTVVAISKVVWHGDEIESLALVAALEKNCGCLYGSDKINITSMCSAHVMLRDDQRALNGLLTYRHLADRLRKEEGL